MQSKIAEGLTMTVLVTHQPIELSATGNKLLTLFPEVLGVPVLDPDGTSPIWLLLAGMSDVELPELPPGGAPPLKAF